MLRNNRLVSKAFRHNRGAEMAGTSFVAGVAGVKMGVVLNIKFKRIQGG
jgi:hypothetical protein